jgi:hypothetical protein
MARSCEGPLRNMLSLHFHHPLSSRLPLTPQIHIFHVFRFRYTNNVSKREKSKADKRGVDFHTSINQAGIGALVEFFSPMLQIAENSLQKWTRVTIQGVSKIIIHNATNFLIPLFHSLGTLHVSTYMAILRCLELSKLLHCTYERPIYTRCIIIKQIKFQIKFPVTIPLIT